MCGIAGFVDAGTSREMRHDAVRRMCAAMVHRGPDDEGTHSGEQATLGMRRLAIFDPANGQQPMRSPDGRLTLVFNGAIYNFRALRTELAGSWQFRTECDTEVLLAAYARWGEACVERLRGMFAFAVWDERNRSLFLARDPLGIKPLYYSQAGAGLLFASELNALSASGVLALQIDPISAADYLAWLAVPAPRTIYRGVFTLRPGECATFAGETLSIRRTWDFRRASQGNRVNPCATREEFSAGLRAQLEDSIRAHVAADVPVGAFLSGGLDSAVVVALMARVTGSTLRTFAIGFDETDFSEAAAAEATARHLGTRHETHRLTGADVARDLETLLASLDQPTGDGINTFYASRAARAGGVTVALSGLGGDELFGGYPSFRDTPRVARWLPAWRALPRAARRPVLARLNGGDTRSRKLADVLQHARNRGEVSALQRRVFSETARHALLARDVRESIQARAAHHPEFAALSAELDGADAFAATSAWELRTYMADVLLRDSDVMSMRHSLELRVPFVDRPLIEWLWRQPAAFKHTPRQPKAALANATRDLLPPELLTRAKRGFTLPFALWMKRELRPFLDDVFSEASVSRSGLLEPRAAQALWRSYVAGDDTREWSRVWSLAVLIAFANRRTPARTGIAAAPVVVSANPRPPAQPARGGRTLLLAPEIASEGGIPRILRTYLRALSDLAREQGGHVRLLALNDGEIDADTLTRQANGSLEAWRVCRRSKARFVASALAMSRDCDRIVCGHVAQLPVAWLAQRLNPRIKYYLVAHGIEVWRSFSLPERLALRGAERILCVSDCTRRELLKHCPLPDGRAVVLPNALDPDFEITPGRPLAECPPVILTVTRLSHADRYKGVDHLIAAMPEIRAAIPDARLRIIGRGDDRPRLERLAQEFGVTDTVEFLGYVDDARLREELKACRLFALPSEREGFGLVYLEAMAHGRPCLAAQAGGAPEVIAADTGVLVPYGSQDDLERACIEALRSVWNATAILAHVGTFSYPVFRDKLTAVFDV